MAHGQALIGQILKVETDYVSTASDEGWETIQHWQCGVSQGCLSALRSSVASMALAMPQASMIAQDGLHMGDTHAGGG